MRKAQRRPFCPWATTVLANTRTHLWNEFPGTPSFVPRKVRSDPVGPPLTLCIRPVMYIMPKLPWTKPATQRCLVRSTKCTISPGNKPCSVPEGTHVPAHPALARTIIGSAGCVPFGKFGLGCDSFWPGQPTKGTAGRVPVCSCQGGSADGRAESRSLGEGLRAGLVGYPAPHTHMSPWTWGS